MGHFNEMTEKIFFVFESYCTELFFQKPGYNCSKMPGRWKIINSVSSEIKTAFRIILLGITITVILEGCYYCMSKFFLYYYCLF